MQSEMKTFGISIFPERENYKNFISNKDFESVEQGLNTVPLNEMNSAVIGG